MAGKKAFDGTEDDELVTLDVRVELEKTGVLLVAEDPGRKLVVKPELLDDNTDLDVLVLTPVEIKVPELVPDDEVGNPVEVVNGDVVKAVWDVVVVPERIVVVLVLADEVVRDTELVLLRSVVEEVIELEFGTLDVEAVELVELIVVSDEAELGVADLVVEGPEVTEEVTGCVETVTLKILVVEDWIMLETEVPPDADVTDMTAEVDEVAGVTRVDVARVDVPGVVVLAALDVELELEGATNW
ncbi:S-methyl-5-thioribose-1-phosphate isomerase [Fonsecaea nubica]|uniref:S-methyl-5-thioribose-1-phosphate isomerase n=1 Tax=Fonsecaea nubica TaxID=856822 RepID=A0A178D203_9EURO|nr:S-methyl-5-thioribose-1-phosphate isomerase [Fonsecaea nubica]OAL36200.1 S-methyl-5-thioribose-1-phosphate isomerase [Fonsecaea nubica]